MTLFSVGSGYLHRRKIRFTHPRVRPTRQVVREALISLLNSRGLIDNKSVYLPFAGSGIVGFDLLSAGTQKVTFLDNDSSVIAQLAHNCRTLNIDCPIRKEQVRHFHPDPHDIVVADPPYRAGWSNDPSWMEQIVSDCHPQAFLLETERSSLPDVLLFSQLDEGMRPVENISRLYGETRLTIFLFRVQ